MQFVRTWRRYNYFQNNTFVLIAHFRWLAEELPRVLEQTDTKTTGETETQKFGEVRDRKRSGGRYGEVPETSGIEGLGARPVETLTNELHYFANWGHAAGERRVRECCRAELLLLLLKGFFLS